MGEVYRATDTDLKRSVAIKVLPASVAVDAERLARFRREAEVLAALNHPHIAQIHGLEKSDGTIALVMELVEGPTLADRIAQGAIPIDETLPIANQIAEALEAAHEQGIIHRDLKPANIKVRADGTVKVLDFGLAKAMEPASPVFGDPPTMTSPAMTEAGVILGTAAYMAPEQARGKAVDRRADIWAFGAVVYEMLSGRRLFKVCNYVDRRYSGVIEVHRKTQAIDPSFVYFQSWLGAAYRELGDYQAALREYAVSAKALNDAPQYGLALTYLRMGRDKDAREIMRRMDERARTQYVPFITRAEVHAALGDLDTSVALLQQALDRRESFMFVLRELPEMAPLLMNPRAQRIVEQADALRKGQ
jgi:serine/threonine protein kinase